MAYCFLKRHLAFFQTFSSFTPTSINCFRRWDGFTVHSKSIGIIAVAATATRMSCAVGANGFLQDPFTTNESSQRKAGAEMQMCRRRSVGLVDLQITRIIQVKPHCYGLMGACTYRGHRIVAWKSFCRVGSSHVRSVDAA